MNRYDGAIAAQSSWLHHAAPDTGGVAPQQVALQSSEDVVRLRKLVRDLAVAQGMSLVDQTKLVTAASELARNTVIHGGGGHAEIATVAASGRRGVQLRFVDQGPGIADVQEALRDGFTTGNGMGLGLGGARRLSDAFDIVTAPGQGTTVTIARYGAF
ncbi:anti-sigma regulatory factor [Cupriavidus sp. 2TAF22]|uniref:anti-sigma regulatory factor n=1 Tax=unclassified Cupriavidus TaxID=2640874 RepID=UPI003F93D31C